MSETRVKISELKPGMENINVTARVLESLGSRTVNTRAGVRTLTEYIVGDESGRVKLVVWGLRIKPLNVGEVINISGAWVSTFKGEVQLNVGGRGKVEPGENETVPPAESIPETSPKAEGGETPRRPTRRGGFRGRGGRRPRRSETEEFSEE